MGFERKPICLGIAGGSGSGKSWLARRLKESLGVPVSIICQDWYYHDNGGLSPEEGRKLNFDHPESIETSLLVSHLAELLAGRPVEAPRYDYATHSRLKQTRKVEPAPVLILEGLFTLQAPRLRGLMEWAVYIQAPDDVRLMRRIRRDSRERRVDLEETLRLYEHCVKPMHDIHVAPSAAHATWVWRQAEDKDFPGRLTALLRERLSTPELAHERESISAIALGAAGSAR
ncbi:MAG: uridine kinase [Elusimicrobia bacterium]|nr:uridine kinase [Elusimicrobiota bacterium]